MFEYKESRNISSGAAFFIMLGFVGAGLIIGGMVGMGVWLAMTGRGISTLEKDLLDPVYANAARIFQLISAVIMIFIPAVATAFIVNRKPFKWLGFKEGFNIRQFLFVILIMLCCFPLVGALGELNKIIPLPKTLEASFKSMEDSYAAQVNSLATIRSMGEFIFSLLILALLPALFEEALFRGSMQQILIKWFKSPVTAIIVTALIFSIIHISWYGFLPRFALGVVLGLVFHYSGSIWLSVTGHFLNNAVGVSYMYYLTLNGKPAKEAMEQSFPIWLGIPAILLVILLLIAFRKISIHRHINKIPPMDGPSHETTLA